MSTATRVYLGLDFGTESVRAVLVDDGGRVEATAVEPYPHGQITPGSDVARRVLDVELRAGVALQDPRDWLVAAAAVVRRASAQTASVVAGIGVDATSCTVLPVRHDGTPLVETELVDRRSRRTPGRSSGSTTALAATRGGSRRSRRIATSRGSTGTAARSDSSGSSRRSSR